MNEDDLREEQRWLARRVHLPTDRLDLTPEAVIFGIDVQYVEEEAYCAVVAYRYMGYIMEQFVQQGQAGMPYQSGFFCFREGPPIVHLLRTIIDHSGLNPDVLVIDGHGIAHPRRLGVASWVGVKMGLPSIGIAKRPLLRFEGDLAIERGATLPLKKDGELRGAVLRTQSGIQPIYVSPGHLVSIDEATEIALQLAPTYRIVEPIRAADQLARHFAKGERVDAIYL